MTGVQLQNIPSSCCKMLPLDKVKSTNFQLKNCHASTKDLPETILHHIEMSQEIQILKKLEQKKNYRSHKMFLNTLQILKNGYKIFSLYIKSVELKTVHCPK